MSEAFTAASTPYTKPLPEPTPATRPYWDAAREHRLVLQRSKGTGKFVYYPRAFSPFSADDELEWVEVSGRGTVYAFTVARRPTAPQWTPDCPYVIAIVELEEGPRLTANILGCEVDDVRVGMPVSVRFEDVTPEVTLVQFEPRTVAAEPPVERQTTQIAPAPAVEATVPPAAAAHLSPKPQASTLPPAGGPPSTIPPREGTEGEETVDSSRQ